MVEYPDTGHAFDYPLMQSTPMVVQNGQTTHCTLKEEPAGTIINMATQKAFTYADDCAGHCCNTRAVTKGTSHKFMHALK